MINNNRTEDFQIDWLSQDSILLLNPRWPEEVQGHFRQRVAQFENHHSPRGWIFLATSGTTAKDLRQTKLVALTKEGFLKAAQAVGQHFNFGSRDVVLQTLPIFHVGGLSQWARAFVWRQTLISQKNVDLSPRVTHTSMVPTQIYDVLQKSQKPPASLRCVFVGGGVLSPRLEEEAMARGWPLAVTYGMTETAALVAVRKGSCYQFLPHAEVDVSVRGRLMIRSESLALGYLTEKNPSELDRSQFQDSWFETEDFARIHDSQKVEILGRSSDYLKINGEGVYLSRLQEILQDCLRHCSIQDLNSAFLLPKESDRRGYEIHLYSTLSETEIETLKVLFNEKVLPFERIHCFHKIDKVPVNELGKIRRQEVL